MLRSKNILIGLTLLFLTACGTPYPGVQAPEGYRSTLTPTDIPVPPVERSNGSLAQWLIEYDRALMMCNLDKRTVFIGLYGEDAEKLHAETQEEPSSETGTKN